MCVVGILLCHVIFANECTRYSFIILDTHTSYKTGLVLVLTFRSDAQKFHILFAKSTNKCFEYLQIHHHLQTYLLEKRMSKSTAQIAICLETTLELFLLVWICCENPLCRYIYFFHFSNAFSSSALFDIYQICT